MKKLNEIEQLNRDYSQFKGEDKLRFDISSIFGVKPKVPTHRSTQSKSGKIGQGVASTGESNYDESAYSSASNPMRSSTTS